MRLFYGMLSMLTCFTLSAQSNCWTNLTTQNSGIPSSRYNDIVELGPNNFLLASDNGLVRYDGSSFLYLSQTEVSISNVMINSLELGASNLYIGTNDGFTILDSNSNSKVFVSGLTGLNGDSVNAFCEDAYGNLWVGTEAGVSVKSGINWYYINGTDLTSNHVTGLEALLDSSILVTTDAGVTHISGPLGNYSTVKYTQTNTSNGLIDDNIQCVYQTSDSNWWFGTQYGISEYDGTNWTKYTSSNTIGLASNDIRDINQTADGTVLIATAFGLTSIDSSGAVTHLYSANGLAENVLSKAIYSENDSAIYLVSDNQIAGNNNGLHIFNGSGFENFERENTGMPTNQPLHLVARNSDMFSGYSNGIYQRGASGISQINSANSNLLNNSIRDLSVDQNDNLWALTNSGISQWNGTTWTNYSNGSNGLPSSSFILQGMTDSTFVVSNTFSSGVVYWDGSSSIIYKSFNTNGITTNSHNDFELIDNGRVAVATSSGLSIFDGSSFSLYQTSSGLASNNVKSLSYDKVDSVLWLGYNSGSAGISSMNVNTGAITNYTSASVASSIKAITVAPDSILYFISGSNYYKFDAKTDSLSSYNSGNTPLNTGVLNDIEYLNNQLWIATGSKLHIVDDFDRRAIAITYGEASACNADSVIIASLGNFSTVLWSNGSTGSNISTDSATTVYYTAADATGCQYSSDTVNVQIFATPIPDLFLSNDTSFCQGESNTITTWDYFDSYTWSNGNTGDSVYVTENGSYWVSIMDTNGCFATSDTINIEVWSPYSQDSLCIITVDSMNHNQLIWNKTSGQRTFQYGIYKQNPTTGQFDLLTVHPASGVLSVFSDVNSNAGITSSRYGITVIDSCGNESPMSLPHETMHLTINEGINGEVNLIWDGYEGIPITTYEIWRGASPKQMFKIDEVSSANFTYTDLNAPVGLLFYKIVVVNPFICNPTVGKNDETENFNSTQSNIVDYALTDNVIIYPNPFSGQTRVVWSNPDLDAYSIKVYDAIGRLVFYETDVSATSYDLYQNDLPSGIYAIELTDGERLLKTDFIIE